MSGDKDPIGKNGKGVLNLKNRYKKLGVKNLSCKLYEGGRHDQRIAKMMAYEGEN